jgi:hypothetical protein
MSYERFNCSSKDTRINCGSKLRYPADCFISQTGHSTTASSCQVICDWPINTITIWYQRGKIRRIKFWYNRQRRLLKPKPRAAGYVSGFFTTCRTRTEATAMRHWWSSGSVCQSRDYSVRFDFGEQAEPFSILLKDLAFVTYTQVVQDQLKYRSIYETRWSRAENAAIQLANPSPGGVWPWTFSLRLNWQLGLWLSLNITLDLLHIYLTWRVAPKTQALTVEST